MEKIYETKSSFMSNSAIRGNFNFYFSAVSASIKNILNLEGRLGTRL